MQRAEKFISRFPFVVFWFLLALLYAPAWKTGFVHTAAACDTHFSEITSLFHQATGHSILGLGSALLHTFLCKIFGAAWLPWYLLYVSLQAFISWLLFRLSFELLGASNPRCRRGVAFWGAIAFCLSPYLPEVLLGETCMGCMCALALILGILLSTERYIYTRDPRLPKLAALLFFFAGLMSSTGLMSIFLTIALLCFYKRLGWEMAVRRKTWRLMLLPQAIILSLQLLATLLLGGSKMLLSWGHILSGMSLSGCLSSYSKAIFEILLFGDFWPAPLHDFVFLFLEQALAGYLVFLALIALIVWLTRRATNGFGEEQTALLLLVWLLLVLLPVLLPESNFSGKNSGHSHIYLPLAFLCMLLAVAVNALKVPWLRIGIPVLWMGLSLFLTLRENRDWPLHAAVPIPSATSSLHAKGLANAEPAFRLQTSCLAEPAVFSKK